MTNTLSNTIATNKPVRDVVAVTPTEIVSPKVLDLVQRYNQFARASAENIIELAKTLVEAKRDLSEKDLVAFYREVGLNPKSSTYRKLSMIGKNAARLEPHVAKMPAAWTTVYNLAKLPDETFKKVVKDDRFSPFITAKKIAAIIGPKSRSKHSSKVTTKATDTAPPLVHEDTTTVPTDDRSTHKLTVTLDLSDVSDDVVRDVCYKIRMLRMEKRFNMSMSADLRALLEVSSPAADAQRAFQLELAGK